MAIQILVQHTYGGPFKMYITEEGDLCCPICGFEMEVQGCNLTQVLAGGTDICPHCRTHLGVHDVPDLRQFPNFSLMESWASLRVKWLDKIGWPESALEQLRTNLGIDTEALKREAGRSG